MEGEKKKGSASTVMWVTLPNIEACFIREMWFVDYSCIHAPQVS